MKKYPTYFAIPPALTAFFVLMGWQFDLQFFKRILPGLVAMNPATGATFLVLGLAILFSATFSEKRISFYRIALSSFAIVTAIGVLKLAAVLELHDFGIDRILFAKKIAEDIINGTPNRMAPNTALCFMLAGLSGYFSIQKEESSRTISNFLAFPVLLLGIFSIIGYLYGVKEFYGVLTYIPMALHTAVCFIFYAGALLAINPESGFMRTFTSPRLGGRIFRTLLPLVVLVPILFGYIRLLIGARISLAVELYVGILITSIIFTFFAAVWYVSSVLNRIDLARTVAEERLQKSNKGLEAFSYSVSHDLRAPLRAVSGYTKILIEDHLDELSEDARSLTGKILANADRMGELIEDLLQFSKSERAELRKAKLSMKELVETIASDLKGYETERDVEFRIHEIPDAFADFVTIRQVWINLISNALKYTKNKSKAIIEIGSEPMEGGVAYFVKDNGAGFNMNYYGRLFGVFQRLHAQDEFEGTGVGLATVKSIVERHGGKIWAEGEQDRGAIFHFSLPT